MSKFIIEGPYFEDLEVGQLFGAPSVTLTSGMAAVHQSILGERFPLSLDAVLSEAVTGRDETVASPSLVWNVAIGQSTVVTRNARANLFYRDLQFKRFPVIGDTLHTTTEIVALRTNRPKPDRPPTGLAVLSIVTRDSAGQTVLDFKRCAMLPVRDTEAAAQRADDLDEFAAEDDQPTETEALVGWDLAKFQLDSPQELLPGDRFEILGGDCVTSAPELCRLTLNIASLHHDGSEDPEGRLVFGGHTIGLALAQATRAIPSLVTVLAWHSCDHIAPIREGDTLWSSLVVERLEPFPSGSLVHLRSQVVSRRADRSTRDVLRWRFIGVTVG